MGWDIVYRNLREVLEIITETKHYPYGKQVTLKTKRVAGPKGDPTDLGHLWVLREFHTDAVIREDIAVYLLERSGPGEIAYKEIGITEHPYLYDVPRSWLKRPGIRARYSEDSRRGELFRGWLRQVLGPEAKTVEL